MWELTEALGKVSTYKSRRQRSSRGAPQFPFPRGFCPSPPFPLLFPNCSPFPLSFFLKLLEMYMKEMGF